MFSTTIAETSLTFKNLRFVIDSGKVRVPVFNIELQANEMTEMIAPQSTLQQRRGRLGRLKKEGIYYLCSELNDHTLEYHSSELEKIDLTDVIWHLVHSFFDPSKQN